MDVHYIDSDGRYHIDWLYFLDVVRLVGISIVMFSLGMLIAAIIGGANITFIVGCLTFGFALIVEGTLASFFKVGD